MISEADLKGMSAEEVAELQKKNCIFCHIVSGKVPAKKIFEDDKVLAFLDINPASPGHILLIPKVHHAILPQIPDDEVAHLFRVSKKISNTLLKSLLVKGTNIFVANGAVAGQKAPHFMIHVIPRSDNDGVNLSIPENEMSEDEIAGAGKRLIPRIRQVFGVGDGQVIEDTANNPEEKGPYSPQSATVETVGGDSNPVKEEPRNEINPQPRKEPDDKIDIDALKGLLERK